MGLSLLKEKMRRRKQVFWSAYYIAKLYCDLDDYYKQIAVNCLVTVGKMQQKEENDRLASNCKPLLNRYRN